MIGEGNADSKWSYEKKIEGEDSVKTVDCLRGRLLAERVASKNAKEEAENLGNKLVELENLLKKEAKSRNRAEKKLKYLITKLEAMNISHVSDETEHSGSLDKSDISSISSSISSKEVEEKTKTSQLQISTTFECQESKEIVKLSKSSDNTARNRAKSFALQINLLETKELECDMRSNDNSITPKDLENLHQSQLDSNQSCMNSKINES